MHVTFELTPDDFWNLFLYYRRHRSPIRPVLMYSLSAIMGLVFLGGAWVVIELWLSYGRIQSTLLLCLPILLFCMARILPPRKGRVIKIARQRPGLLCEHTIGISPEWFSEKTDVNETKVAWATIKSLEEDPEYLYVFVERLTAHAIPKRVFSSPHEVEAFLRTARRYWEAAKSGQAIPTDDSDIWPPPPRVGA